MEWSKLSFVLLVVIGMSAQAVAASVAAHHEPIDNKPTDHFLSAASISTALGHICSGVILNERWVITAAHCIESYTAAELQVSYGSSDRNSDHKIISDVEQIEIHPQYQHERLINNVALVKVKKDIIFGSNTQPANLPIKDTQEEDLAVAIGWEKLGQESSLSEALKYYQTKVMALDLCWERLEDLDAVKVNDNIICTYGPSEEESLPLLDNGTALISVDANELVGIASWYEQSYPNVYNRIRSHIPWIKSIIHV